MKVGSRARMWEQLEPTGPVWVGFQPQRSDGEEVFVLKVLTSSKGQKGPKWSPNLGDH